jgi:ABC-type glutathione transport system ATPase component
MTEPKRTLLEVTNLCRTFASSSTVAVDHVSFSIPPDTSLGLVGESGSGKSTIARILAGLERPDAGTVTLSGRPLVARPRGRARRLARARAIQMVFQDPTESLDSKVSVGACLGQVLRLHGHTDTGRRQRRVEELLDQVELERGKADALPRELSGGQRQRVAIARALAVEPALLILDEAVSALDAAVQAQILQLLAQLRRETRMAHLFISHHLATVNQVTEQLLVLLGGRVVERGATAEVLRAPTHPYTQLLLDSVPHPGWRPEEVARRRAGLREAASSG